MKSADCLFQLWIKVENSLENLILGTVHFNSNVVLYRNNKRNILMDR